MNITIDEANSLEINIVKVLVALIAIPVCILTATGNILVLVSFKINKKLRTANNYFLMSLAIADLTIGLISMPISTVYFITERWLLGPTVCDLWLSLDYAVSNASVANLILISFDRYFSITRPLTYRVNRTSRKVILSIGLSWIVSFLVWTPFIISWPYIYGKRILDDDECKVQFLYTNKYLTLSTCFIAFYLPVIIICAVYYRIWVKTKVRQVEFRQLLAANNIKTNLNRRPRKISLKNDRLEMVGLRLSNVNMKKSFEESKDEELKSSENSDERKNSDNGSGKKIKTIHLSDLSLAENTGHNSAFNMEKTTIIDKVFSHFFRNRSSSIGILTPKPIDYSKCKLYFKSTNKLSSEVQCKYCNNESESYKAKLPSEETSYYSLISAPNERKNLPSFDIKKPKELQLLRVESKKSVDTLKTPKFSTDLNSTDKNTTFERIQTASSKKVEKKQDQKAAKMLSAILLAFIITWTPYNINVVVNTFCDNCLSKYVFWEGFAYWLCYMNSTINPILYALCNASFRKTFREIFAKFDIINNNK